MICGIGIDIIEVERVQKLVSKKDKYLKKIYTDIEIEYCEKFKTKAQEFAGRFSAKEAFSKALGTGISHGIKFNEIEIVNDELGKPEINLYGGTKEYFQKKGLKNIFVSISHLKEYATTVVVIEK
ncbi:MAG: holo-ACP synthase [Candidatus Cloacimonetes bacterium]|nr:holo-ACP synthase [Candidatus Cloacimonadota bacterium]